MCVFNCARHISQYSFYSFLFEFRIRCKIQRDFSSLRFSFKWLNCYFNWLIANKFGIRDQTLRTNLREKLKVYVKKQDGKEEYNVWFCRFCGKGWMCAIAILHSAMRCKKCLWRVIFCGVEIIQFLLWMELICKRFSFHASHTVSFDCVYELRSIKVKLCVICVCANCKVHSVQQSTWIWKECNCIVLCNCRRLFFLDSDFLIHFFFSFAQIEWSCFHFYLKLKCVRVWRPLLRCTNE